jgi:hypothetical protein
MFDHPQLWYENLGLRPRPEEGLVQRDPYELHQESVRLLRH